jgi:hypothetical protein
MSCGDSLVVQLRLADGQAFHFGAASRVPELQMGARLRVLVTPEPGRAGSYQLLAAGWEQVLAAGDPKGTAATSANTRAGERARPYPSRGAGVDNIDRSILAAYQQAVRYFNRRLSDQESLRIAANIINNSAALGVDARLVMAVVAVESGFNPNATSPKGAMGLGQLMPTTARGLGVRDAYDPEQNLSASVRLIGNHLSNTGDISLALACYNAGAGAVRRYGGVPPYRETINYIRKVTSLYYRLAPEMRP